MIEGTDLAYCNPNVNYRAMADADIRFACIKLGQGRLAKDVMFDTHTRGCESVGVPWDPYWFCDYRISGAENVTNLIQKANGNYGRGHVVQDLEFRAVWGYPDGWHMLRFCLDFFGSLELQTGIIGVLYTNRDLLNQMWAAATPEQKILLARHSLWFATDSHNPAPTHLPILLNQCDLDIPVSWARERVDLDEFIGTEEQFLQWMHEEDMPPLTIEQRLDRHEQRLDRIEDWISGHGGW